MTLTVVRGSGTIKTYTYNEDAEVVRLDLGKFHGLIDIDEDGPAYWKYQMEGTPPAKGRKSGEFFVKQASIP